MTHPNQGPIPGHTAPLTDLDVASGVNEHGHGFVQVLAAGSTEKRALRLTGQLTPAIARQAARNLLEAAEAALSDQALYAVARDIVEANTEDDIDLDLEEVRAVAGRFITSARHQRGQAEANEAVLEAIVEAVDDITEGDVEAELEEAGE